MMFFLFELINKIYFWVFKKYTLNKVSKDSGEFYLFGYVTLENPGNITIGKGSTLNQGAYISGHDRVFIGERVSISTGAKIITAYLDESNLIHKGEQDIHLSKPVYIGNNTQIGAGAIVLPGVSVGADCIVGAGSVVTRNISDGIVVVGNPAREIRKVKYNES
ncbi:TPA: acyltransferase [Vibrio alginolyticus]|nr:hypothetical protein [Vibrio alginolyticus]